MSRVLALLTVGLIAGTAVADLAPPPPPKGKKYVSVDNEVVLGKDVTGFVFVKQVTQFLPGRQKPTYSKVELKSDKATAIPEPARRTSVTLFAVPADAAKEFKTDAELFGAIEENKVKGAAQLQFDSTATVKDAVKGESVKWTHTITDIDKNGIKVKVEGEGYEPPAKKPGKKEKPLAQSGTWVAGLAAFAALTLGGLWLAGRGRRKV